MIRTLSGFCAKQASHSVCVASTHPIGFDSVKRPESNVMEASRLVKVKKLLTTKQRYQVEIVGLGWLSPSTQFASDDTLPWNSRSRKHSSLSLPLPQTNVLCPSKLMLSDSLSWSLASGPNLPACLCPKRHKRMFRLHSVI